ncbi:MAG: SpoIIE family protein phosphatase [Ignavibacteriaceae bacterium]|nr:SpoIIE family protein phosphatase [Ignavibacteriaceae bacterium]
MKRFLQLNLFNFTGKVRVQIFLIVLAVLLSIKLFFVTSGTLSLTILNEVLVLFIFYSVIANLFNVIGEKTLSPISLVSSLIILLLINLVFFNITELILDVFKLNGEKIWEDSPTLLQIVPFIFNVLLIFSLSYIFIVYRMLFFLQQKKNLNIYFNALILFFILSAGTAFIDSNSDYEFIKITFTVNAIILIVINSVRISWIAFLTKKQKKQLIWLSVSLVFILSLVLAYTTSNDFFTGIVKTFAPSISQFFFLLNLYGIIYFSVLFFTTLFHIPTAEAYDRKSTEVSTLQYFSKMINQVLDFNELADTVAELAIKVCNADAAWIVQGKRISDPPLSIKNIPSALVRNISERYLSNDSEYSNIRAIDLKGIVNIENPLEVFKYAAIAPLKSHHGITGYIVLVRKSEIPFDAEEKNTLQTFSDYTSIAFENSRLLEESIEKERLEKELDVAREMQMKLMPRTLPKNEYLDIASIFIPAFEVGGDYYDFFKLKENKLGFVIADVSGKGISAAFIMAEIRGVFESLVDLLMSPKEILTKTNMILKRSLDSKSFVTATFGVFDFNANKIFLSRAGHCPLILIRNGVAVEYRFSGIGLGLNYTELFGNIIEEVTIDLMKDDLLIFYTDGITEAKNENLEDYGIDSLKKIILEEVNSDVEKIANKIVKEVTIYSQNSPQHDDITLVVFKWK